MNSIWNEKCGYIFENGEMSSELEVESNDCKETIRLEIKEEIRDPEDLQDPSFNENGFHESYSENEDAGIVYFILFFMI